MSKSCHTFGGGCRTCICPQARYASWFLISLLAYHSPILQWSVCQLFFPVYPPTQIQTYDYIVPLLYHVLTISVYQGCINGLLTNSRSLSLISICLLYVKCLCGVLINPFVYNYILVLVCFLINQQNNGVVPISLRYIARIQLITSGEFNFKLLVLNFTRCLYGTQNSFTKKIS